MNKTTLITPNYKKKINKRIMLFYPPNALVFCMHILILYNVLKFPQISWHGTKMFFFEPPVQRFDHFHLQKVYSISAKSIQRTWGSKINIASSER